MNPLWLERSSVAIGAIFFARVVGRWRGARITRTALTTPLVDAALLEAVFEPRPRDGDDRDLLAELKDTLAHLNRQGYAEEFWGLHTQIAALDATLGPAQKATLRRAALRLLTANDPWLQALGAQTALDLGFAEAVNPLRGLLETGGGQDTRFRAVLEEALAGLEGAGR